MKKLITILGLSLCLSGCASAPATADHCVFKTDRTAKVHADFNGTEVGFCCEKCKGKWDGMSDEEKKAALAKK